jgi:hypothetical protein
MPFNRHISALIFCHIQEITRGQFSSIKEARSPSRGTTPTQRQPAIRYADGD